MAELNWTIDGRRFRSQEEYMAAKRDKQLIDSITKDIDLDNPKDIEKIYMEMKTGKYQFESIVGRQFDDNIYELYNRIKSEEALKLENEALRKEKKKQDIQKVKDTFKFSKKNKSVKNVNKEKIRLDDFDKSMQLEIMQVFKNFRFLAFAICIFLRN